MTRLTPSQEVERIKALIAKVKELSDLRDKFERDAPAMSEAQRTTRQKEFAEQSRDFQRKQREFQEDLNGRRNEELQQVLDKANKAVKQVAEAEKFDLIIQEGVAYNNNRLDITDKVLKILNSDTFQPAVAQASNTSRARPYPD